MKLLSIALYDGNFACAWKDGPGDIFVATKQGDMVGEETPTSVYAELTQQTGKVPDSILATSGPGSYTGLRLALSFAKGLAYGYHIPLSLSSFPEIIWHYLQRKSPAMEMLSLGMSLGRGQYLFCSGSSISAFTPERWSIMGEDEGRRALKNAPHPFELHAGRLTDLTSLKYYEIKFEQEILFQAASKEKTTQRYDLFELSHLAPSYGQTFSAKTVLEQRKISEKKRRNLENS